jgi:hypothetical protein
MNQFEDLINMGRLSKDITIGKHVIKITTMDSETQSSVIGKVSQDLPDAQKVDIAQRAMIANSIEAIDGKLMSFEDKMALVNKFQPALINILFSEYESLLVEQNGIFEEVKKNISQAKTH